MVSQRLFPCSNVRSGWFERSDSNVRSSSSFKGESKKQGCLGCVFFSTKKSQENRGYKNESSLGRAKAIAVKLEGFLNRKLIKFYKTSKMWLFSTEEQIRSNASNLVTENSNHSSQKN